MTSVKPKKFLGQHFLKDEGIAKRIVDSLLPNEQYQRVLEVGPGMGVLTKYLIKREEELYLIELDRESIPYLHTHFPSIGDRIIEGDFLQFHMLKAIPSPLAIIGNFPYNISSQIFFRVLEYRDDIPQVVGMLQKEVAERICAKPGKKDNGILSILLQTWYDCEYLFSVDPSVFNPPPKVQSGVLRAQRNNRKSLPCDESLFKSVVKSGFQQRRKTLRNALKSLNLPIEMAEMPILQKRAEQLGVEEFISLTQEIEKYRSL
jgi:16S rRNA (adenine1518-N6/adenine1519-N6)-dimethyltransferase